MYTSYTCIYTIHTPLNTSKHPIYTLYTLYIHHCRYLHDQGIMHRDIKCSNLLIGKNHVLKLADLGLARSMVPPKDNPLYTNKVGAKR